MNTAKQFVKLRGKALHCSRNIAFSCIQTTSDQQRKLILYSFTEKRGYTCSLTREGLSSALFPSSFSSAFFLLLRSWLVLVNPERRDSSKAHWLPRVQGAHVKMQHPGTWKMSTSTVLRSGAYLWRGTVVTLIKFIILSLPLPLNLTIV